MPKQSRSARNFAERKLVRETIRMSTYPILAPNGLLVHSVPLIPPYPKVRLTADQEGGLVLECRDQFNDCPGLGEVLAPDRGRVKPWPPQFEEDLPNG